MARQGTRRERIEPPLRYTRVFPASAATGRSAPSQETVLNDYFELIPDAIVLVDRSGSIVRINRQAERMFGYEREELLGKPVELLMPEQFRSRHVRQRSEFTERPHMRPMGAGLELVARRKDGSEVPVDIMLSPVEAEAGDAILALVRDITDRKRVEQELRRANDELELRVAERTSELRQANESLRAEIVERKRGEDERRKLEDQLQHAQKMEALGRFAGGIAHDFNNLLTGIMAFTELLLEHLPADDPLREGAEEARRSCERSALLTRQLLALSRKQIFDPVLIDLSAVIGEMGRMLRRLIGEDVELVATLDPDLGLVKGDPSKIEQVILNLAVNARDAMQNGGRLAIETAKVDVDEDYARQHAGMTTGSYVMLAVSDTGTGMTPEVLDHIFEPFFTTKERGKGTGLGLSTVYGIVAQTGGRIWVYSEPGHGTTFKIYFPRADVPAPKELAAQAPAPHPRGSETVLVVEDEKIVRMTLCTTLRSHGYTVLEAGHGREALELSRRHEGAIDLMVTDVVMPELSGPEVAERLAGEREDTKVLYISAHMDDALLHRGVLSEGSAFLEKPFTREQLLRTVRRVLDGPPQDRSA